MAVTSFEHAGEARAALAVIAADPAYGSDALSRLHVLPGLLSDFLPDAPREAGLLIAAAQAGVPDALREHAARGMGPATAVRIVAASFAARTAFSAEACSWVAGEFAVALGLASPDLLPASAPGGQLTEFAERDAIVAAGEPSLLNAADPPLPQPSGAAENSPPALTARPAGRRRMLVVGPVIVVALMSAGGFALYRDQADSRAFVPPARLGQFVPAGQRVLHVYRVHLTRGPVPQEVVTTTGQPVTGYQDPPENLLLLAWDQYAHRWSAVYDADRAATSVASDPDAVTSSYAADDIRKPTAILPAHQPVLHLKVTEVRDQPQGGADLLFTAVTYFGASGYGQLVGIIHFNGHVATIAWAFEGDGGTATVIGTAPRQQVAVTNTWLTPADPQCCAVRSYRFVLTRTKTTDGESYQAISDTRPWLGVLVAIQPGTSGQVTVMSVIPGSPAAGILEPGDILTSASAPPPGKGHLLDGPPVIDQIARNYPGDTIRLHILRDGQPLTTAITLSTMANPKVSRASASYPLSTDVAEFML